MKLFSGSSHENLAAAIAKQLKIDLGQLEKKQFSSGENYVRFLETVRDQSVFIVQTGTANSNQDIIELLLLCQAAKLGFAKDISVVIPYFPYARQDRVALPREPISAKLIADLLQTAGTSHVITLDLHSDQMQGFFGIPVDCLNARHLFAKYIQQKELQDLVVVSPDAGGAKRAKKFADMIGADLAIMHKNRPNQNSVEIIEVVGTIKDRTCILFDDIIDTASSLAHAKNALVARGCNKDVYAVATHGVFSGNALETIKACNFKEVIISNSLPVTPVETIPITIIDTAPMFAEVIERISAGKSVTTLYT